MEKDKILKVRIDDYTDKRLSDLEKKYGLTRSEIVRRSIGAYDADLLHSLFVTDMMDLVLSFGGAYTLENFGIAGKNYLEGNGFWIVVKANFKVTLTSGFTYGAIKVSITDNSVHIDRGFLQDIHNILSMIYSSAVKK